ncbi:MAG: lysophospholipid acyltransferase family protein [Gammaproteobacteria bacterium]|nr:MAG: lysophospholipid acyltransferase family protein [Gammaproteobacteria bacterium]
MSRFLRFIFYRVFIRLIVMVVLGLNIRHKEKLPQKGPAIIVANHNSHLDTMVLMTLLPAHLLPITKPVAAADYFLRNPLFAWFALKIVGILPIKRKRDNRKDDLLAPVHESLNNGNILIFFPEGSRGEPEHLTNFKGGVAKLAQEHPDIPIIPVLLHGLGKALPKGEALLVPFFCDVFVGDALYWAGNKKDFMQQLEHSMELLSSEGQFSAWE